MAVSGTTGTTEQNWTERPERAGTTPIRLMVWIALRLGRGAARLLLYPISLYFLLFSPQSRAASRQYLGKVLESPPGLRHLFRHYYTFAACVLDRVYLLNDQTDRFDIRVHGEDVLARILARGRGCLLLGAHLGSFEVMRAIGAQRANLRGALLMYEDNARKINSVLNAINDRHEIEIISLGRLDSMLKVEERLDRGEFISMLADRCLGDEGKLRQDFFGEPAAFPLGPFRIAAMLRRPIVLIFGLYHGNHRYDIYFEELADLSDVRRGGRSAETRRAQERYVRRLEHYCRLEPYNWFNFYDFWK